MVRLSPVQASTANARNRDRLELSELHESNGADWPDLDFWRALLAGAPPLLELPLDRPRMASGGAAANQMPLALSAQLTADLRRLSRTHGVTVFMTLFAGFASLLSRLGGQNDLVLGIPALDGHGAVCGPGSDVPLDALAMRVRLQADPSAAELLAHIKELWLRAHVHQHVRLADIIEALRPPTELNRHPVFQVMVSYQVGAAEPVLRTRSAANLDLSLCLRDAGESIDGVLEYAGELFDRSSIERIAGHFVTLLESIVADDRRRVSELNLLSPGERRQVLADWNATSASFPTGTLPQLLAGQVVRTPDADAVVDGGRRLSYAELDRAADSLAAALQQRGVGPETIVGVALNRSLETVVAAWAILKAGGVYLPLDPAYPPQRLQFSLRDARAVLVLTDQRLAARLPADVPQWHMEEQVPAAAPRPVSITAEHLAYVIYTSGSTGEPKGVAMSHASAVNLAFARRHAHDPIGPGDRVLAAISVGFDVSIGQLLLPLLCGACVVIAPDLNTLSAEEFWALVAAQRVSHINSVPSFLDSVIDVAPQQPGIGIKRLMLGGESLTGALCRRLRAALPGIEIFNMYGPTEACIDATFYRVPDDIEDGVAGLPIGRPLPNYRAYVLDVHRNIVPPNVAGELYLAGAGLAREYLGQPLLTAERFVADPFGSTGARLYRTGDRALWRADGTLVFLGRADEQVKIRGFRVEPGEIEAVLRGHPQVAQAAVLHRPESPGNALVVYVVAQGPAPATDALRQYLVERLPAHMIPTSFVWLGALPLTPNGKLDRKALSAVDGQPAARTYEAPLGELEITIARVWQRLLDLPQVSRHDDFFALGANSLLVLRALSALKSELHRPIAMAAIFQAPTPAQFAALMSQDCADPSWKYLVLLRGNGYRKPLFCLNGFNGDVDDYLNVVRYLDPSVPAYGLRITPEDSARNLQQSLATRIDAYEQEIRSVQPLGPYRLCGFSFGGSEAFDLATRLEAAGEEVVLIFLDAYRLSRTLIVKSWLPRLGVMLRTGALVPTARRKLRNLFAHEVPRWLTGESKDLKHALLRHSMKRKYSPLRGRVILFKSNMSEYWAFELQLDRHNGWKKYVKGRFDVVRMDCGHLALITEPVVKRVVSHINAILCD